MNFSGQAGVLLGGVQVITFMDLFLPLLKVRPHAMHANPGIFNYHLPPSLLVASGTMDNPAEVSCKTQGPSKIKLGKPIGLIHQAKPL